MIVAWIYDGLGNQLFQYAFARKWSLKCGTQLKLDITSYEKRVYRKFQLNRFNICAEIATPLEISATKENGMVLEQAASIYENHIQVIDNYYVKGYWQSWRYFDDVAPSIRRELQPKTISDNARFWADMIEKASYAVSIHIRRGDYVSDPLVSRTYGILPLQYYKDSLQSIKQKTQNPIIFVFSDDINWAKKNLSLEEKTFFIEGTDAIDDLYLISCCQAHILSNSTFSWWGAWLNPRKDKIVYVPAPWFVVPVHNGELLPSEWIRIPVNYNSAADLSIKKDFFGLIITVYNQRNVIEAYMKNLFNQTFTGYTVYIIDDGSVDGSYELCQKLYGKRNDVTMIRTPYHMGKYAALNIGLSVSKEKYIMFMNLDDTIVSNMMLEGFHRTAMVTEADIVQSGGYWVPNNIHAPVNGKISLSAHINDANIRKDFFVSSSLSHKIKYLSEDKITEFLGDKAYKRMFLIKHNIRMFEQHMLWSEYHFILEAVMQARTIVIMPTLYGEIIEQIYYLPSFDKESYRQKLFKVLTPANLLRQYLSFVEDIIEKASRIGLNDDNKKELEELLLKKLQQYIFIYKTTNYRQENIVQNWINKWL